MVPMRSQFKKRAYFVNWSLEHMNSLVVFSTGRLLPFFVLKTVVHIPTIVLYVFGTQKKWRMHVYCHMPIRQECLLTRPSKMLWYIE